MSRIESKPAFWTVTVLCQLNKFIHNKWLPDLILSCYFNGIFVNILGILTSKRKCSTVILNFLSDLNHFSMWWRSKYTFHLYLTRGCRKRKLEIIPYTNTWRGIVGRFSSYNRGGLRTSVEHKWAHDDDPNQCLIFNKFKESRLWFYTTRI